MVEVLVVGKKISEMELVTNISGDEKIPTGAVGDKAVTTGQLVEYLNNNGRPVWGRIVGDLTDQADLQNRFTQERDDLKNYTQDQIAHQKEVLQDQIDVTNRGFKYILENGAALPYNESIEYVDGAPVLRDGVIKYKVGDDFKSRDSVTIPTYNNVTDGVDTLIGVADGDYFNVRSTSKDSYVDEYQNIGGVPTPSGKSYPSSDAINNIKHNNLKNREAPEAHPASAILDASGQDQQFINDLSESSVKLFGAKGNGNTSDVAAILDAQTKSAQLTFTDGTYLIDSDLTISAPVSFTKKAKLKVTNGAKVTFSRGTCDEVCAHWFSGNTAIQDAVYAAKSVKAVFIRSGVWLLDSPLLIPTTLDYWGLNIRGACDAQEYGNLSSSRSTILRANASMNVVLGNRESWKGESGYYNKISNLAIEANNLANYGYINGYQDTVTGVNVTGALIGGIIYGSLSNSSSLYNVSATRNQRGLILTGLPPLESSTHAVISNCRFRQNFRSGVTICQATGVRFVDTVIESNDVVGVEMLHNNTSDDFYAGSAAFTSYIMFDRVGMENNAKTLNIDGAGGISLPSVIEFKMCNLVGQTTNPATPLSDIKLQNVRGVVFDRNNIIKMGLEAGAGALAVQIKGYQVLDTNFPTVFGVNSSNVQITKITDACDVIDDHILYSQYAAQMKTYTTSATLTKNDVFGSVITNAGQAAVDLTITLPTTGLTTSPRYSPSFTFVAVTQQLANKLTFQTQSGAYFIYQGAQRTKLDTASNGIGFGVALKFTLIVVGGVQNWLVENIQGSWNAS